MTCPSRVPIEIVRAMDLYLRGENVDVMTDMKVRNVIDALQLITRKRLYPQITIEVTTRLEKYVEDVHLSLR
jgi:hypothetical protein